MKQRRGWRRRTRASRDDSSYGDDDDDKAERLGKLDKIGEVRGGSDSRRTPAAKKKWGELGLGFEEPRTEGRGEREQRKTRHQGGLFILGQGTGQRRRGRGGKAMGVQDRHCSKQGKKMETFHITPCLHFLFLLFF